MLVGFFLENAIFLKKMPLSKFPSSHLFPMVSLRPPSRTDTYLVSIFFQMLLYSKIKVNKMSTVCYIVTVCLSSITPDLFMINHFFTKLSYTFSTKKIWIQIFSSHFEALKDAEDHSFSTFENFPKN